MKPFKNRLAHLFSVLTLSFFLVIAFQNCNKTAFKKTDDETFQNSFSSYSEDNMRDNINCVFNGLKVNDGEFILAYRNSTEVFGTECVSENRLCNKGSLSGSYSYSTCDVNAPQSCLFNGKTIQHGEIVKSYKESSVAFGQHCREETRTCSNGILSGTAEFASCQSNAPKACLFNGLTIVHGGIVKAYKKSSVSATESCEEETRLCHDGQLSGDSEYASCVKNAPRSCLFNGLTVAHGQVIKAAKNTQAYNQACEYEDRLCTDSILSGTFENLNCTSIYTTEFNVNFESSDSALDMIWVIDNSASMTTEAANVRTNFNNFLPSLKNKLDFRFLLISQKGTWGTSTSIPASLLSANMMQVNQYVGSHDGPSILLNQLATNVSLTNFFRPHSKKIVVFVTDDNANIVDHAAYMAQLLIQTKWSKDSFSAFGFVAPSNKTCASKASNGVFYEKLSSLTQGSIYNLCDTDWKPNFDILLNTSISKAIRMINLSEKQAKKIISVEISDRLLQPSQYAFDGTNLTISDSYPLVQGEKIIIQFEK